MYVIDLEGEEYATQITYLVDEELNGSRVFEAVIEPNKPNLLFLEKLTEMWTLVDDDETEYKIVHLKKQGKGNEMYAQIKAIPHFIDKFSSDFVYEEHKGSMTAVAALDMIFNGSGYNYILNGNYTAKEFESFGSDYRLNMFKEWLNRYGGEFGKIAGNTVYIDNLVGNDLDIMYRHRLNASNIVQEIDATSFYTFARGYGDYGGNSEGGETGEDWQKAKLIREYTSPLAKIPGIGLRHAPPIKNGNITKKTTMDSNLKKLVDESLKISVTADIHDLTEQGYPIAQAQNGDRVFLIDERIGLNEEVRVVNKKVLRDWRGRILDIELTFGSQSIVKRHQSNLNSAIQTISDIMNGNTKLPINVLDSAVIEATKALRNAETELKFTTNGILAIDKNNPNLVTLFNSAGLGVSEDGGETFKNAITGLGINASTIVTGYMLANRIRGGVLLSINNNTEFNLNTGELIMKNADFTLGGGAYIRFTDAGNRIQFRSTDGGITRSSGMGVGKGTSGYPFVHIGVTGAPDLDALSPFYTGLIIASSKSISEGGASSITSMKFQFRNKAVGYDKGLTLDFNGSPVIRPINGHEHNYSLGESSYRFNEIFLRNPPNVSSDERMKTDISKNVLGLDFINDIETVQFRLKQISNEENKLQYGLIAQQVLGVLEKHGTDLGDISLVNKGDNDLYGIEQTQLIAPIIKALQDLYKEVEILKREAI